MKNKLFALPYILINILIFYFLPYIMGRLSVGGEMAAFIFVLPVLCFLVAFIFGIKHSFCAAYPITIGLLFVPAIFIMYNESAWPYTILFGLISLLGMFLGNLIHKMIKIRSYR